MHEIWRLDGARPRSVSAENPAGAPGAGGRAAEGTGAAAARELGAGSAPASGSPPRAVVSSMSEGGLAT
ncbi:hypothetical protein [Amycolatopsis sp. NPDC000740]|uniref:hypothetical protein n=1 Tax=Amycolatopsis sp. NPDC000740 TaxID=3154269 RepID=UPI00331F5299